MRKFASIAAAALLLIPGLHAGAAPSGSARSGPAGGGTVDPACAASAAGTSFANQLRRMPDLIPTAANQPLEINVTKRPPQVLTSLNLSQTLPYQMLYNGIYPGPTVRVRSDIAEQTISSPGYRPNGPFTQVRFTNQLTPADDIPFPFLTTHLHGGHTAPEHDGHPDDLYGPFPAPWPYPITEPLPAGRPAPATNAHTYAYTNDQQPQILWYHDHADGNTANHVGQGLFGFYLIEESDPALVNALPPRAYDIPLGMQVLSGTDAAGQTVQFAALNGVHNPVLNAEPRNYRFRLLNASVGQSIDLVLCDGAGNRHDRITEIATDGGLLPAPIPRTHLEIFQAERYDILVDLSGFTAREPLYLYGAIKDARGCTSTPNNVCQVSSLPLMQFVVDQPLSGPDPTRLSALRDRSWDSDSEFLRRQYCAQKGLAPGCPLIPDRVLEFDLAPTDGAGQRLMAPFRINEAGYSKFRPTYSGVIDPATGATQLYPQVVRPMVIPGNTVEVWKLVNKIGCIAHPIHIHDIEQQIIEVDGRPVDPKQYGWKDVFVLRPLAAPQCFQGAPTAPERSVTIIGYFENNWAPTDVMDTGEDLPPNVHAFTDAQNNVSYWKSSTSGTYVFHCHNLQHEDDAMMGQMTVDPPPFDPVAAGAAPAGMPGMPGMPAMAGMPAPGAAPGR
jgi:FtsP/CotA-like multicopper oxidase with cupredoxin domain